ncbi:MAG: 23S rRNA (guanosine(2251)-2'-O)-methyltransferase RlmB [Deltaproteobacteria bacterium]|nr:23S rRNA (guanosine(2251)-2'-O)-methyltransferase RlmB [Deltaproteobacteria bacterium]
MAETICGIHPVTHELLSGGRRPREFCCVFPLSPRLEELAALARKSNVPIRDLSRPELEALAGTPHHQGVVLVLEPFAYTPWEELLRRCRQGGKGNSLVLLLDSITDPRNFGAILRSADAAGCRGVIIPKDRSCPVTGVVHKASSGALAQLPVCRVTNLARAMEELKREGFWIYGLAAEGSTPLFGHDLKGDVALVVGCEGKGLRPQVRKACDAHLSIPMAGRVASLNVAVAASIALFEVVRQRSG